MYDHKHLIKSRIREGVQEGRGKIDSYHKKLWTRDNKICFANVFRGQTSINLKRSLKF